MSNGVDFRKLAVDLRGQLTTAQSDLAALREELAKKDVAFEDLVQSNCDMGQFLAAAEQRNVALETAIRHALDDSAEDAQTGEITIMQLDYETLATLIDEPTESGASDADRKADDEALQRRHDQERQEYFNDESGASE